MKKIFLLSALFVFAFGGDLFAQDYKKLSRKKLRIEHQKKLNLIDSLSQELNSSNVENLQKLNSIDSLSQELNLSNAENLQKLNSIDSLSQKLLLLTKKNQTIQSKLKSNLELLNSKISLLNQELTIEKEISQKLRDLATIRDFSDGTFNDEELAFITNYFKIELKSNVYNEEERESKAFIDSTDIQVSLEGEAGYVPAFYFKRNYNTSLAGDLDKDGTHEIIFNVEETGGGNAVWFNYYCLKIFNGNPYEMFQIEFPCPCKESEDCGDTRGWIVDVSGDILTISSSCFLEDDANCCPSSDATSKYKFDGKPRLSMKKK
tara:strand:+ start:107 stop:1063 length:957 start_codon:yes stop_codon:yes gene_type:complete